MLAAGLIISIPIEWTIVQVFERWADTDMPLMGLALERPHLTDASFRRSSFTLLHMLCSSSRTEHLNSSCFCSSESFYAVQFEGLIQETLN
jgi:hypothetical protein